VHPELAVAALGVEDVAVDVGGLEAVAGSQITGCGRLLGPGKVQCSVQVQHPRAQPGQGVRVGAGEGLGDDLACPFEFVAVADVVDVGNEFPVGGLVGKVSVPDVDEVSRWSVRLRVLGLPTLGAG
jgi:hypothetical protein